jgi:hypothetical protein
MSRKAAAAPNRATSHVLEAGGLLPASAKAPAGEVVDPVGARAYRHPVLADRVVVRLSAENLATGDDIEMSVLGFGKAEPRGTVAQQRRRPLGFPGWALVHDPEHARYALEVVREFKKEARRARSKPGHAKDGIDKIGDRLGKSVPHFLPSYYEEAGRAFIEHGALTFAAMMFGKAREAEAVHALDVDEAHRAQAFLEFALAGAVTTKALAAYAKDLSEHRDPDVAYQRFRDLCVKRTLGGMPPWGGMAKELRRLAKAAGKDPDAEDAAFVADVIESPALVNAAGDFWKAYEAPIKALARATPAVRGRLLDLWPDPTPGPPDFEAWWIGVLDGAGALAAIEGDVVDEAARPAGGRAAWFDAAVIHAARDYSKRLPGKHAFDLLRRIAPKLVADGVPISCLRAKRYGNIDVDLAELALELGVPVMKLPDRGTINLEGWAGTANLPERGRDPVRIAQHPDIGPLIVASVAQYIGSEPFDAAARGKHGLLAAKRKWLEDLLAAAETGGVPALEYVLETIDKRVTAATFSELPDLHARLAAIDVAPILGRSLRGGIVDELGWPALEEAVAELDPDRKLSLTITGAFPVAIVTNRLRAIAIGAGGRIATHDLALSAKAELHAIRLVQGQFLVLFREGGKAFAYWSDHANDVITLDGWFYGVPVYAQRAVVLKDGAVSYGGRAVRAGDRAFSLDGGVPISDGETVWRAEYNPEHRLREVSTATGDTGRISLPPFLEQFVADGWMLNLAVSYTMPSEGIRSPFGERDGRLGVRARMPSDTARNNRKPVKWEIESIDGARWSGLAAAGYPIELLALPGDDRRRPVMYDTEYRGPGITWIADPTGTYRSCKVGNASAKQYARGQAMILPAAMWHLLSPRDPDGSAALRATTDGDARSLIDAVDTGGKSSVDLPADLAPPDGAIAARLSRITHPRLRQGVAGTIGFARRCEVIRGELVASRHPSAATVASAEPTLDETALQELFSGKGHSSSYGKLAPQVVALTRVLFDDEPPSDGAPPIAIPATALDWLTWAIAPGSLVFASRAFGFPANVRAAVRQLVRVLASTPMLASTGRLRLATLQGTPPTGAEKGNVVVWSGGNAYFLRVSYNYQTRVNDYLALEYARSGSFRPLAGMTIRDERPGTPATLDGLDDLLDRPADPWSPEIVAALAERTGLTVAEASLVWAGFPNINAYSSTFLDKDLREAMGLKQTMASTAKDSLRAIPVDKRIAILAAGGSDPAVLARGGTGDDSAVARLADAWNRIAGKRTPIPDALLASADREMTSQMRPGMVIGMLGNPAAAPELQTDAAWSFVADGQLVRGTAGQLVVAAASAPTHGERVFNQSVLDASTVYLPYLFYALPVGDPLRANLPAAYAKVLERLAFRDLWIECGNAGYYGETVEADIARDLALIGGDDLPPPLVGKLFRGGAVLRRRNALGLALRPSEMSTADDVARVRTQTARFEAWSKNTLARLEALRSPALAAMMARVGDTPVPSGSWEQNPLLSAPAIVADVGKTSKLSPEASALYLQMLALLWPTPKNIQKWNGWTATVYKKAIAELEKKELVLEAKRERAQRDHFIPGGWEALKTPHPPMETWKVSLYTTERSGTGDPVPPLGRFITFDAPHALYAKVWARVGDDPPRYEDVSKAERKKKS